MLTCKEVAVLLSQDVDGELPGLKRAKLQAHLAICGTCRQIKRQFRFMTEAIWQRDELDLPNASPGLPPDSATRLKHALRCAKDSSRSDQ